MSDRARADLNAAIHAYQLFLCPTCGYNTNHYEDFLEHQKQHLPDLGPAVEAADKLHDFPINPWDTEPSARLTGPTSRVRTGKSRSHKEGVSINIFRGDETLLATVYGGDETEARMRAQIVANAFADFYITEREEAYR